MSAPVKPNHVYESPLVLRLRADLERFFERMSGYPVGLLDPAEGDEIVRELTARLGAEVRP